MTQVLVPRVLGKLISGRPSLKRNFLWTFTGNTFYAACQWALLSVLAKLTTPEMVGKYALAAAVVAPLMIIANFNVGVMLVTDTHQNFRFAQYRTARGILIALNLAVMLGICLISRFTGEMLLLTLLVGIAQSADCMSELYRSVMQRAEQMSRIAGSLIIRGAVSLLTAALILYYTKSIVWALAGMALTRVAVLIAYDVPMGREQPVARLELDPELVPSDQQSKDGFRTPVQKLKSLSSAYTIAKTALPLTVVSFLTSLVINLPRYFIEHYSGPRALGLFAAMWSLLMAGVMVAIALGQALFPRLSNLYAAKDLPAFKKLTWNAVRIALGLGIAGIAGSLVLGKQVLTFAFGPAYAEQQWLLVGVMAAGTLIYMVTLLGYAATAARAFKNQALLTGIVTATTFIASALLVPQFGVWGAVEAISIGWLSHIAGLVLIVRRVLKPGRPETVLPVLSPKEA